MTNSLDLPKQPSLPNVQNGLAYGALFIALVSISLAAIFIKFSEGEISPYATAFNRFWITTLVMSIWHQWSNRQKPSYSITPIQISPWDRQVFWRLLLVGIFLALDLVLWAWSITQTSVANATLLANLTPIFTSLGGWLIWKRRIDQKFLLGLIVAVSGSVALGLNDLHMALDKLQGDLAALLAAFAFGIYLLLLEDLQNQLDTKTILLWSSAIAGVLTFPVVFLTEGRLFPHSWHGWLAVIALALICQIIGQGLLVYSLNHLSSGFVALFLMLDPILAALGAWACFSEHLSLSNWLAFAVVLLGIYLALSSESTHKEEMAVPT